MSSSFLLIGSNDIGFSDIGRIADLGFEGASGEMGYSGGAVRRLYDEHFDIEVVRLQDILGRVKARTSHSRLDGIALMTCRPYGDGSELLEALREIRGLDHNVYQAFEGVPASVVPVVLSDIKQAMAGRAGPAIDVPWSAGVPPAPGTDPHQVARNLETLGDRTYDCLFKLVRAWRLDLLEDLEVSGLVIGRSPSGELRPRVALRRKPQGGRMHLATFNPENAYRQGLPVFEVDLDVDQEPFAAFQEMLDGAYRRYATLDRTKTEIALHRYLETNPQLLRTETYREFLSEVSFTIRNGRRQSIRPDLILQPIDCRRTSRFQIVEMKLPSHPVAVGPEDGRRFSRAVLRAIEQVRRYRKHLLDPDHAEEVARRTGGVVPADYEMAILIGMRSTTEAPGVIKQLQEQHAVCDVSVIRYNEVIDQRMKLWGRESPLLGL